MAPTTDAAAQANAARQAEVQQHVPALQAAIRSCDVGIANAASVGVLREAVEKFAAVGASWAPPIATDHAWWLGMAHYALGRAELETGDADGARLAYDHSITAFERAGDVAQAADMRARRLAIDTVAANDFDSAAAADLHTLLGEPTEAEQRRALASLASSAHHAGDAFEFMAQARALETVLVASGFEDPAADATRIVERWTEVIAATMPASEMLAGTCDVATQWMSVWGARAREAMGDGGQTDDAAVERAERAQASISAVLPTLFAEAEGVQAEVSAALADWFGDVDAATSTAAGDAEPHASAQASASGQRTRLQSELHGLQRACNAEATAKTSRRAEELVAEAQAVGGRTLVAQALLMHAYVLLALQDFARARTVVADALWTLSPGRKPTLRGFAVWFEQEVYMMARQYDARAYAGERDHESLLDLCERTIAEIEAQRALVSTPYQRAAVLTARIEFFEYAAVAAYKLGRHDALLQVTERLKAGNADAMTRAASRATREPADDDVRLLDSRIRLLSARLAASPAGTAARSQMAAERQRVANARAIAVQHSSTSHSSAPPSSGERTDAGPRITARGLSSALGQDETALSWFWLDESTLIALVCTRDRFEPVLVELTAAQRQQWDTWLQIMDAFGAAAPAYEAIIPAMDALIDALAAAFIPPAVQALVAPGHRLILSPHRALHLFPFHAARLPNAQGDLDWLLRSHRIRYTPGLSGIVERWEGNDNGDTLAIGIEQFGEPDLPPLPNAVHEARDVAAAHGAHGVLALDVSRAEFLSLPFNSARAVHLATHGGSVLADQLRDDPLASGVQCADGAIDGVELATLRMPAELVVIAACYSGQRAIKGRGLAQFPADDVLGLQAALFSAGVGTVLGALWPVDDDTTRTLLVDFHQRYAGGSAPDEALQETLLHYLGADQERSGRYWWAPFFLTSLSNPHFA